MKKVYLFLYGEINTDGRVQSMDFLKSFGDIEIHLVSCGMIDFPIEGIIQHQTKLKPLGLMNYMKFRANAKRIIKSADVNNTIFYLHDYIFGISTSCEIANFRI